MSELISAVRVAAKVTPAKSAIIFLHGLGDTGEGWSWLPNIINDGKIINESDRINYVFPNAPTIPITMNNAGPMPAWFNIYHYGTPNVERDVDGVMRSCNMLKELIREQVQKYNVPQEKIIIGGFSQGAVISLITLAQLEHKIGGVIAFSGFCPIKDQVKESYGHLKVNSDTPIFQAHGNIDPMIPFENARLTSEFYKSLGYKNLTFKAYPHAGHEVVNEELADFVKFIAPILQ